MAKGRSMRTASKRTRTASTRRAGRTTTRSRTGTATARRTRRGPAARSETGRKTQRSAGRAGTTRRAGSRAAGTRRSGTTATRRQDALAMLVKDHHAVSELFERFERGFRTDAQKAGLIEKVCDELTVHARIEEKHLYPAARRVDRGLVGHAIDEHKKVKDIIARLRRMDPDDAETDELMSELISDVRDHVEEEEDDLFPKLRDALGREALLEIGTAMMQAKRGEKRRMKAA